MTERKGRAPGCSRADATTRLRQAEAFVNVAELALDDDTDTAGPGAVAALAVLAGIAASDAACCARLGVRARGRDHRLAVDLVSQVRPHGASLAKDLGRLLAAKDDAHYGLALVAPIKAKQLLGYAQRMVGHARQVLES